MVPLYTIISGGENKVHHHPSLLFAIPADDRTPSIAAHSQHHQWRMTYSTRQLLSTKHARFQRSTSRLTEILGLTRKTLHRLDNLHMITCQCWVSWLLFPWSYKYLSCQWEHLGHYHTHTHNLQAHRRIWAAWKQRGSKQTQPWTTSSFSSPALAWGGGSCKERSVLRSGRRDEGRYNKNEMEKMTTGFYPTLLWIHGVLYHYFVGEVKLLYILLAPGFTQRTSVQVFLPVVSQSLKGESSLYKWSRSFMSLNIMTITCLCVYLPSCSKQGLSRIVWGQN